MSQRWMKFTIMYLIASFVLLLTNILLSLHHTNCSKDIPILITESSSLLARNTHFFDYKGPNNQALVYGSIYVFKTMLVVLYIMGRTLMEAEKEEEIFESALEKADMIVIVKQKPFEK